MKTLCSIAFFAVIAGAAQAQSVNEEKLPVDTNSFLTVDEAWSLLATQYPGFGGYYQDGDQLVVQLADTQARASGTRVNVLLDTLRTSQNAKSLRTQTVNYGFDQLYKWHFQLIDLMQDNRFQVHSFDLDEVNNVIALSLDYRSSSSQIQDLQKSIAATGVPSDAVQVRLEAPPAPMLGLSDRINPTPGGAQINYVGDDGKNYMCSLGLSVKRGVDVGFITAAHCQDRNGEVYRQAGVRIGASVSVGSAVSTGCPSGATCKHSDALFAKYDSAAFGAKQQVAYAPNGPGNVQGNLNVIQVLSTPAVGTSVWKTGRTTGSTNTVISASCQRIKYNTYPTTFLCLNKVDTQFAKGGDSGGPVWIVSGGNNITFTGLVSGGGGVEFGPFAFGQGYYSPMSAIQKDLGTLTIAY